MKISKSTKFTEKEYSFFYPFKNLENDFKWIYSESIIFQGVLDKIATRSLSTGTNAWTDTDHTCYTMTTAGSEGFLNLLPVYLDHILYPLLTVIEKLCHSKFLFFCPKDYLNHLKFANVH